jgi:hypothetical protein
MEQQSHFLRQGVDRRCWNACLLLFTADDWKLWSIIKLIGSLELTQRVEGFNFKEKIFSARNLEWTNCEYKKNNVRYKCSKTDKSTNYNYLATVLLYKGIDYNTLSLHDTILSCIIIDVNLQLQDACILHLQSLFLRMYFDTAFSIASLNLAEFTTSEWIDWNLKPTTLSTSTSSFWSPSLFLNFPIQVDDWSLKFVCFDSCSMFEHYISNSIHS